MPVTFEICSHLRASPAEVWSSISTMRGVNDELAPLMRMTHPPGRDALDAQPVRLGERLFRSWMLLFGVLPVDYDDLVLTEFRAGEGFHERSTMLSMKVWEHDRRLTSEGAGCTVFDRLSFEPRLGFLTPVLRAMVRWLFTHRHLRLRARFGDLDAVKLRA